MVCQCVSKCLSLPPGSINAGLQAGIRRLCPSPQLGDLYTLSWLVPRNLVPPQVLPQTSAESHLSHLEKSPPARRSPHRCRSGLYVPLICMYPWSVELVWLLRAPSAPSCAVIPTRWPRSVSGRSVRDNYEKSRFSGHNE